MKASLTRHTVGFVYGILFGLASPIPGISAGSMAVLLNVYEKFLTAVSPDTIKKNKLYTFVFLIGWALGLYAASNVLAYLFKNHRQVIHFSFMGLIIGCLPQIYGKAAQSTIKPRHGGVFIFAFLCMTVFAAIESGYMDTAPVMAQTNSLSPLGMAWVFAASLISSAVMMLPGVGGSLMMLVLGIYEVYIEATSELVPVLLALFGVSMAIGVWAGILLTKRIFIKHGQILYFAILGFIAGSLFVVYPGWSPDAAGAVSLVCMAACAGLAWRLGEKGQS
jgi:putative membrane protein